MCKSKYRIEETDDNSNWDLFVRSSLNGTAFIESTYLNSIEINIKRLYCYKSNRLRYLCDKLRLITSTVLILLLTMIRYLCDKLRLLTSYKSNRLKYLCNKISRRTKYQ